MKKILWDENWILLSANLKISPLQGATNKVLNFNNLNYWLLKFQTLFVASLSEFTFKLADNTVGDCSVFNTLTINWHLIAF